jgi:hypothetical protein
VNGLQQIAGRPRLPVEPRHHQHVAGIELGEQAAICVKILPLPEVNPKASDWVP